MTRSKRRLFTGAVLVALLSWSVLSYFSEVPILTAAGVTVPNSPVAEGKDFATLTLRDSWDMSEFTDISQDLNADGNSDLLRNIQVQNGVFSAQSTPTNDAQFSVLFPGFYGTIQTGKVGSLYPIPAQTYHCLYIATKVDSGAANQNGPDQMQVFWSQDSRYNNGGVFGASPGVPLYPEAGAGAPTPNWKLYKIDLATIGTLFGASWNSYPTWQGLRIDPTLQPNVTFAVDWVRLTDCASNYTTITWSPQAGVSALWLQPLGTTRNIRVASDVNGSSGSYRLDTQGIAPGSYLVGLGDGTNCCSIWSSAPLVINQTPIVTFDRPSTTSGPDYATMMGNPWDMNDGSDTPLLQDFKNFWFAGGLLNFITASGSGVSGDPDAKIYLNTPRPLTTPNDLHYLSFRLNTEGAVERFGGGMIVRWIWTIPGTSGRPGYECHLVGLDIPYDVGWQTYSIDLSNPTNGTPVQKSGECPAQLPDWVHSGTITKMRFDPNENITGQDMVQHLDWVKLTGVDRVKRTTPFPIQSVTNKAGTPLTYYYTTTPQQPTQHLAQRAGGTGGAPPGGPYQVFLPLSVRNGDVVANDSTFFWDTSTIPAGQEGYYYICAVANDGVNQATYCSDAPVWVY